MKKAINLFNHISDIKTECEKLNNELRETYTKYEDFLTLLDPEGENAQIIVEDMSQIRATIDSLDLTMRSLSTACTYADDAQWTIGNVDLYDWEA